MKKWYEICLPDIDDSHIRATLELQYANYTYNRMIESVLEPFDLSHEQFNILKILQANNPSALSLKEVQAELTNQTKNTTRLVEKLRNKGFVESVINPDNKRQLLITITQKGLNTVTDITEPYENLLTKIKSSISTKEAEQLSGLLSKIYKLEF